MNFHALFLCNQVGHLVKECPVNKKDDNIRTEKEENSGSKPIAKTKSNTVTTGRSRGKQNNVLSAIYSCGQGEDISTYVVSISSFILQDGAALA